MDPPAGEGEEVEAILSAIQAVVDRARAEPEAVLSQGQPFAKAEGLANAYGFSGCGSP